MAKYRRNRLPNSPGPLLQTTRLSRRTLPSRRRTDNLLQPSNQRPASRSQFPDSQRLRQRRSLISQSQRRNRRNRNRSRRSRLR